MHILVSGSRSIINPTRIREELDACLKELDVQLIIEGGARGADTIAYEWARDNNIPTRTFNADWKKYGKRAGIYRNEDMLREGKPHLVIAFPTAASVGTRHMISIAKKAGVATLVIEL